MSDDRLLTELERQEKYLSQLPADFSFPLFNARHAVESQRKSGYRSTSAAAREIVDNSIEAGANRVHIVFDVVQSGAHRVVKAIGFIDNGSGMLPTMARYALSWGGGTHFDDPSFIGKFGFGLPNASINQTRRVEVYTRTEGKGPFTKAWLDINDFATHGLQVVPEPVEADLPPFVSEYLDRSAFSITHGTVVVWVNPDRLTYRTPATLKEHIVDDFGATYRYLLARPDARLEIVVEGVAVEPVDPLFLDPKGRLFVSPEDGGSIKIDERYLPLKYFRDPDTGEAHLRKVEDQAELLEQQDVLAIGTVYIQVARFPLDFALGVKKAGSEKTDAHRRFEIRKTRRGMSFVRAGREIVTLDAFPRSERDEASGLGKWPLLQSYAYHWGAEVRFDPALDEVFGITNDKQSVRPIEDFWRVLHVEGIDDLLMAEDNWQTNQREKRRDEIKERGAQSSELPTAAEQAAYAADVAGTTKPSVPEHAVHAARQRMEAEARERASTTKATIDEAIAAIVHEGRRRPYRVDFFDSEFGPFYRPEWIGNQIVVNINRKHPFFGLAYGDLLRGGVGRPIKEAVDLLLITLSKAELTAHEQDLGLWYSTQREQVWSPFLGTAMRSLGQILSGEIQEIGDEGTEEAGEAVA